MREFQIARDRQQHETEHATLIAYQTVRVWVMTKNKKKMPKFSELIPSSKPVSLARGQDHARAALEILAARMGGTVRARRKEF